MAYALVDRILTVIVTATVTSAAWIVVGGVNPGRFEQPEADPATPIAKSSNPAPAGVNAASQEAGDDVDLLIPVEGVAFAQLRDTFSESRDGGSRRHDALDIMAPAGTPVVAAAPGTIEKLFRSDAGGNTIYLRSADRRTIYYFAHLEAYAPGLKEGQRVSRGQRLGTVGSTGNASPDAPHLHFAMLRTTANAQWWEPAEALNPYDRMKDGREES